MKITKTFISVFLAAFFVGITISYLILNTQKEVARIEIIQAISPGSPTEKNEPNFSQPKTESLFEPEIFGLIDNSQEEKQPKYQIKLIDVIETGNNFRKDEVIAKSGEIWLGLFMKNAEYQLDYTKVRVRPEQRTNYGWNNSVTIKISEKKEPVFLLKNTKNLSAGKIETLYRSPTYGEAEKFGMQHPILGKGFNQEFQLGKRKYTLKVKHGLTTSNKKVSALVLETDGTSQIVEFNSYYEVGDNVGNLLWVGDLDDDGKLDFYMDYYSYEKGGFGAGLYLSSESEKGQLVKQVAYFETTGC